MDAYKLSDDNILTCPAPYQLAATCFAHATIASIRALIERDTNMRGWLPSTQFCIDCCRCPGNSAGGNPFKLLMFIMYHGVCLLHEYPFWPNVAQWICDVCNANQRIERSLHPIRPRISIRDFVHLTTFTVAQLKKIIKARNAPILCINVGIEFVRALVDKNGILTKGIYPVPNRNAGIHPHCVNLTGYGGEGSNSFFWVKNSYGPQWGDNGYLKVSHNLISHADSVSYPVGAYVIP